jgi:hypothetical protein
MAITRYGKSRIAAALAVLQSKPTLIVQRSGGESPAKLKVSAVEHPVTVVCSRR